MKGLKIHICSLIANIQLDLAHVIIYFVLKGVVILENMEWKIRKRCVVIKQSDKYYDV